LANPDAQDKKENLEWWDLPPKKVRKEIEVPMESWANKVSEVQWDHRVLMDFQESKACQVFLVTLANPAQLVNMETWVHLGLWVRLDCLDPPACRAIEVTKVTKETQNYPRK